MKKLNVENKVLSNIYKALFDLDSKIVHNESTFKNNFFHFLNEYNHEYEIISEKPVSDLVIDNANNYRLDFFLKNSTAYKQYSDVAIEFKIDCVDSKLIQHDIEKLDSLTDNNSKVIPLFINVFTRVVDFSEIVSMQNLFTDTVSNVIIILKNGCDNFYYKIGKNNLNSFCPRNPLYISNSKRFKMLFYQAHNNFIFPYNKKGARLELTLPNEKKGLSKYFKISYFNPDNKEPLKIKERLEGNFKYIYYLNPENTDDIEINNDLPVLKIEPPISIERLKELLKVDDLREIFDEEEIIEMYAIHPLK